MVDAGLVEKLSIQERFWVDHSGDQVKTEEEDFGCKVERATQSV
jgi:hypothetical protein